MKRGFGSALTLALAALSGCASTLSGLDATASYGCKAPEGVSCISVSGIYANSSPGGRQTHRQSVPDKSSPAIYGASSIAGVQPAAPGAASNAIRSNPRLLRVWIAPWEDSDGDLHEEAYVHLVVNTGRWLIEHVRSTQRTNVNRAVPPVASSAEASAPKASEELPPPTFFGP